MKKFHLTCLTILLFVVCLPFTAKSQFNIFELMERNDLRIDEVEKVADAYFEKAGTERGSGYKQYQRWLYERKFHLNEAGFFISPEEENKHYQKFAGLQKLNKAKANKWMELGPDYWKYTSSWNPGNGRITSVAVQPSDTTIIYVSSPGGGVWKSKTSGNTWTPLLDNTNSNWMTVYHVCIDPSNPTVIYAAASSVIKSTDTGNTWKVTGSGPTSPKKVIVHPKNSAIVFAATPGGIYRSTNSGTSWTRVSSISIEDIEFNPKNPNIMYASGSTSSGCVLRSSDNGVNWTVILLPGLNPLGRTLLGVSEDNPDVVYAVQASGSLFGKLFKSTDSGLTYKVMITGSPTAGTNFFGYESTGKGLTGQATYDMAICVNPRDVDEIHIAGIICFKSTNGGSSFTAETQWTYPNTLGYNHADVHALEWFGHTIYSGSDGGVYKSTNNGDTWIDISKGLGIRQFYRISCAKTNAKIIAGGAQDNGSSFRQSSGNWVDWLGADGMDNAISPTNPAIAIGTSQNGKIYKTTNSGQSKFDLVNPSSGNWVTPITMHPKNHDTIYGGWTGVYRSEDGGNSWNSITDGIITAKVECLALTPASPKYIYASIGSTLYRSKSGGIFWTSVTAPSSITSIFVSPTDPKKIWITCNNTSSRVFVSTNEGTNFTNISTGLPAYSARSIVVENNAQEGTYVGMNIGVYYRDNNNPNWVLHGEGLPLVAINDLEIHEGSGKLRVATYGRGVWESDLNDGNACPTPEKLSNSDVRVTKARVSWNASSGAKSYIVEYKESASINWTGTTTVNDTTYTFLGLTPGTDYDWQVSTNCDTNQSAFSESTFKTATVCTNPSKLASTYITHQSAMLSWAPVNGALGYIVERKESSSGTWTSAVTTTDTFVVPSGLKQTTAYNWRVKTKCKFDSSTFVSSSFTTETNSINFSFNAGNSGLRVYPIPATQLLNFEFELNNEMKYINAIITNIEGKELYRSTFDHHRGLVSRQIEIKELQAGLYFLTVQHQQSKLVQKFLVSE